MVVHHRWELFPPLDRGYSSKVLRPLLIGGMVTPIVDADGGVNLEMVQNPDGLLCAIDPWQSMLPGDHIDIFWDSQIVARHDVTPEEADQRLFFHLPTVYIIPDWAEKVFYRLTRLGSGIGEDSTALRLRVKLDLPGGVDKDPQLPGHSELAVPGLPQAVIDDGVDAAWAARGIPAQIVAYPGRAAQDTIELQWGPVSLMHKVTESEAGSDAPIVITVDQATVLAAGDSSALLVHYQVFDEVWNFSTDWSLQLHIAVHTAP